MTDDKTEPRIEPRQVFAKQFSDQVRGGKLFTEEAARKIQAKDRRAALLDIRIASEFFPENKKLRELIELIERENNLDR